MQQFKKDKVRASIYEFTRAECPRCKTGQRADCVLVRVRTPEKHNLVLCYDCLIKTMLSANKVKLPKEKPCPSDTFKAAG